MSRGLYRTTRDKELWRLACIRAWGVSNVDEKQLNSTYEGKWRTMFTTRPRLNFHGCYIARTTYVRHGESSFQDVDYRPCYLVEYYRYLRFFPGGNVKDSALLERYYRSNFKLRSILGTVLMLTTADEPALSIPKLGSKTSRAVAVLSGHYRFTGQNIVSAIFKKVNLDYEPGTSSRTRARGKQQVLNSTEQIFHVQVEIKELRGKRNAQLVWTHYSVQFRRNNGQEVMSTFDLSSNKFPPFRFAKAKSYAALSSAPLM